MVIIKLINSSKEYYGDDYNNNILEQWKTCVEMADKISERRNNSNNFFLTLNSALVAFPTIFENDKKILVAIIGLFVSTLWIQSIINYKKLNSYKFKIINELEKKLPSQPFTYEWYILGRGNDKEKYKRFTDIEKLIPKLFIIIYFVLLVYYIIIK